VAVDDAGRADAGIDPTAACAPSGTSDSSVLDHDGPWSEEDYRALAGRSLGKGDGRVELVDGALVVGPGPTAACERAVAHTRDALDDVVPDGLRVVGPVALRLGPDCVLVPDLVVMRAPADPAAAPEPVVDAAEVLMAVEIVGPEHGAVDRSFKPQLYARARLPYLLLVDHQAPFAAASMVIGGRYHEYARASGVEELQLEEPFRFRLPPLPEQ
jgi:Putative restriction endonuclease